MSTDSITRKIQLTNSDAKKIANTKPTEKYYNLINKAKDTKRHPTTIPKWMQKK